MVRKSTGAKTSAPAEHSADDSRALSGSAPALSTGPQHRPVDWAEHRFAPALIAWQRAHGRHDLPWQNTHEAYRIWLSEIMLQQTQVSSVIPYYQRFLQKFPDNATLAVAPLDSVLGHWAGLGYYARARHLHRCAQQVEVEYGGRFPEQVDALMRLPGIGRSTAAAIAVFSTGARAAILDGNVKRVLTRCFGIDGFPGEKTVERTLWALAERLLPEQDVGAYTQGLMDLGSSLCRRTQPQCTVCPMTDFCEAKRTSRQAELPTPRPKKSVPLRQSEVLLLVAGASVLLEVRPATGIWGGLWALPEIPPGQSAQGAAQALVGQFGQSLVLTAQPVLRHVFTHFKLDITAYAGRIPEVRQTAVLQTDETLRWLALADMETAPLPTPIRSLLQRIQYGN